LARHGKGVVCRWRARGYSATRGQPREAVGHYDAAGVILEALVKQQPAATRYRMSLAYIRHNLGILHAQARRLPEAEQAFREALKIKKPLAEANPSPKYQADLALIPEPGGRVFRNSSAGLAARRILASPSGCFVHVSRAGEKPSRSPPARQGQRQPVPRGGTDNPREHPPRYFLNSP